MSVYCWNSPSPPGQSPLTMSQESKGEGQVPPQNRGERAGEIKESILFPPQNLDIQARRVKERIEEIGRLELASLSNASPGDHQMIYSILLSSVQQLRQQYRQLIPLYLEALSPGDTTMLDKIGELFDTEFNKCMEALSTEAKLLPKTVSRVTERAPSSVERGYHEIQSCEQNKRSGRVMSTRQKNKNDYAALSSSVRKLRELRKQTSLEQWKGVIDETIRKKETRSNELRNALNASRRSCFDGASFIDERLSKQKNDFHNLCLSEPLVNSLIELERNEKMAIYLYLYDREPKPQFLADLLQKLRASLRPLEGVSVDLNEEMLLQAWVEYKHMQCDLLAAYSQLAEKDGRRPGLGRALVEHFDKLGIGQVVRGPAFWRLDLLFNLDESKRAAFVDDYKRMVLQKLDLLQLGEELVQEGKMKQERIDRWEAMEWEEAETLLENPLALRKVVQDHLEEEALWLQECDLGEEEEAVLVALCERKWWLACVLQVCSEQPLEGKEGPGAGEGLVGGGKSRVF